VLCPFYLSDIVKQSDLAMSMKKKDPYVRNTSSDWDID